MAVPEKPGGRRRKWIVAVIVLLLAACPVLWFVRIDWIAKSHFDQGMAALEDERPEVARAFFDQSLAIRSTSGETHFRAGQAARMCDDPEDARLHLAEAERLGYDSEAIELERTLLRVQAGGPITSDLLQRIHEGHRESPHILAVIIPVYMSDFRWGESYELTEKWLEFRPNSGRAWAYRGEILERLRRMGDGVNSMRQAARLLPDDRHVRLRLARLLLETRQPPAEAAEHLEWLMQMEPDNIEVAIPFAVCREAQGFVDAAAALLDDIVRRHPTHAKALYHRGRLELNRDQPGSALGFLQQATEADPSDPEILYSLFLCLKQVGSDKEAREVEERWQSCTADLKRVAELGRVIARSPDDPDLRCEMGKLFLRNNRQADGISWLKSALRKRPDHSPSHMALAEFYEAKGQLDLAAFHRGFAPSSK